MITAGALLLLVDKAKGIERIVGVRHVPTDGGEVSDSEGGRWLLYLVTSFTKVPGVFRADGDLQNFCAPLRDWP